MFNFDLKNDIFTAVCDCHNYGETELVNLLTKLQNANNYYNASDLAKQIEFASKRATNGDAKITVEVILEKVDQEFDRMFDDMFGTGNYAIPPDPAEFEM